MLSSRAIRVACNASKAMTATTAVEEKIVNPTQTALGMRNLIINLTCVARDGARSDSDREIFRCRV